MNHFKLITDIAVDGLAIVIFGGIIAEVAVHTIKRLIEEWKDDENA